MQRIQRISTGLLLLVLGITAPLYAQGPNHPDNGQATPYWLKKPAAESHRGPQAGAEPGAERRQAPRPSVHQRQSSARRKVWQEHRAQSWQSEHRNWQERGGYYGHRIPEPRFRSHFGPRHVFRIHRYPMSMMGGFINFQFGGFGFSILDPLPEYWSEGWYEDDDVYIDDSGDGYYLHNRRHPQDRIAISVTVR